MPHGTYTLEELCVVFQRSRETMHRHLQTLIAAHGFPPRLPCFENLWSKAAVDQWLANSGLEPEAPVAEAAPADPLAARYSA